VTIASLPGGPLASGAIQAQNQENSAIIEINNSLTQLQGSGNIAISPQMADVNTGVGSNLNGKLK